MEQNCIVIQVGRMHWLGDVHSENHFDLVKNLRVPISKSPSSIDFNGVKRDFGKFSMHQLGYVTIEYEWSSTARTLGFMTPDQTRIYPILHNF